MRPDPPAQRIPTTIQAMVFVAGLLALAYGVLVVLPSGTVLRAAVWIFAGALLQVASGHRRASSGFERPLRNPFAILKEEMQRVRAMVKAWDERR